MQRKKKVNIANIDFGREKRCGIPEIIFGGWKRAEDISEIVNEMLKKSDKAIITKVDPVKKKEILKNINSNLEKLHETYAVKYAVKYNERGKVLVIEKNKKKEKNGVFKKKEEKEKKEKGVLGIITAGTSDIDVAEEAKEIAVQMGCKVITEYDVGIAGIHRVFSALRKMKKAGCIIVIAGMEGALPSVVSGLVDVPVIGVPSSVGYGVGENGNAALLSMLSSCSPVATVNIDNGFGAAVLAYKILNVRRQ